MSEVNPVQHASFRNPPIIEAVAALRFAAAEPWSDELRLRIAERLKADYRGQSRQEVQFEVQTQFAGDEPTTTTRSAPARLLLPSADGKSLAGIGPNLLSVHVLKPYPGWAAFEALIRQAAEFVIAETGATGLLEVAVRYIDRIALPAGQSANLGDYFTAIPRRPAGMPERLAAFQVITEAHDPADGTVAILTTSVVPPGPGESFVMLYDLNLLRLYREEPLPIGEHLRVLNELHERQYAIFMDSVTDRARELFQ